MREWDSAIHQVNYKDLPEDHVTWLHYWSIDWGMTHPFSCGWTGQRIHLMVTCIVYGCTYKTRRIVEDHARQIMDLTGGIYTPRAIICDHDAGDRATFERHTG